MSNDEEASDSSEPDNETADSHVNDRVGDATVSRGSGSATRLVDSSQPHFKRPEEPFPAAFEDPLQESNQISAPANTPRTEFFILQSSSGM